MEKKRKENNHSDSAQTLGLAPLGFEKRPTMKTLLMICERDRFFLCVCVKTTTGKPLAFCWWTIGCLLLLLLLTTDHIFILNFHLPRLIFDLFRFQLQFLRLCLGLRFLGQSLSLGLLRRQTTIHPFDQNILVCLPGPRTSSSPPPTRPFSDLSPYQSPSP